MSFFSKLGKKDAANGAESTGDKADDANRGDGEFDIFPDEYTIQKHIGNAWAGDPLSQSKAVKYLGTLAQQERFQVQLVSHGALEPILALIKSTQTNTTILRNSAEAVASLAEHENNRLKIADQGGLDKLLPLITINEEADEAGLRLPAMTGIANLSQTHEIKKQIVTDGGVQYVLKLIKEDSQKGLDVQRVACRCLAQLTEREDLHSKMIKSGLLKKVSFALKSSDAVMQRWATQCAANVLTTEKWVGKFVQDDCLEPLIALLKIHSDPDAETNTQIAIARSIHTITTVQTYVLRIRDSGTVSPLVVMCMKSPSTEVQDHALKTMTNLLGGGEEDTRALEELPIDLLIMLISEGPTEFLGRSACAIANLAEDEEFQDAIVQAQGLEPLIYLASRSNRLGTKMVNNAKEHATRALANLAMADHAVDEIDQKGGLEPVMQLTLHTDLLLVVQAVRGLANMAMNASVRKKMMGSTEILAKIIEYMEVDDDQIDLKQCAVACIQNLSDEPENVTLLVDLGVMRLFVINSDHEEDDIKNCAITGVYNVMMTVGLQSLLALVRENDEDFELKAAQAIMSLCFDDKSRYQIVKQGGLRLLYTLAESNTIEDQRNLAKNIAVLSENDKNKIRMVLEGGLKALGPLSLCADEQIIVESAMTFRNLCHKDQLKSTIVRGGGLTLAANFAASEVPEVHLYSAQAFHFMSDKADVQYRLVQDKKALHALFSLSNSVDREVQQHAVNAIAYMSENTDCQRLIVEGGNLRPLIKLARSRNLTCQMKAAYSIGNIAKLKDNRVVIANEQGIEPLISMTRLDNAGVQCEAAHALAKLALDHDNRVDIVKRGGILPLIQMACSVDEKVLHAGVEALSNLALSDDNKLTIVERGGLEPLITMARNPRGQLRAEAAIAVGYLAPENEELRVLADQVRKVQEQYEEAKASVQELEDKLDTSEADKYALAGEIDKLRNKLYDVMRQSAIRKMKGIVSEWKRKQKQMGFDMFSQAVEDRKIEKQQEALEATIADLEEQLEEQKKSWAEYVNANSNQVDEVYKQQAALKCRVVMKEISNRRMCAMFYFWASKCADKRAFAGATHAAHNKTLYAELTKLKDKLDNTSDSKKRSSLEKQIKTMEKMIENDSTLKEQDELQKMETQCDEAMASQNQAMAEVELMRDKIKKQACITLLKQAKHVWDECGTPGHFARWKEMWFKRKTGVRMDEDEQADGDGEAPASAQALRKVAKLQWLVREMKQEREEMWSEMASLMAMLREFENDKVSLHKELQGLGGQVTLMEEERQMLGLNMDRMNDRVDEHIAGQ